jgi:hypothetical protein
MAHFNHPTFMPLENVGGQTHMDIEVETVGLVYDAFVIVDQISQEAHNIESQHKVRGANGLHGDLKHGTTERMGTHGAMQLPFTNQEAPSGANVTNNLDRALHVDEQPPNETNEP